MTMVLHCGAEEVPYEQLALLSMPEATPTYCPVSHKEVVDMVRYALGYHGHEIVAETHAITQQGERYFGLMELQSPYGDYRDMVCLRNSVDKKFPISIAAGAKVFICDNLSMLGDFKVSRKHTPRAKRDLPGLVSSIIEPLGQKRQQQHTKFQTYQNTVLSDADADHLFCNLYRQGVLNIQRMPSVLGQWENPQFDWGPKTAWRAFNAVTYAMTGRMAERPEASEQLHVTLDGVCERLN
jgi:hypothetical protein